MRRYKTSEIFEAANRGITATYPNGIIHIKRDEETKAYIDITITDVNGNEIGYMRFIEKTMMPRDVNYPIYGSIILIGYTTKDYYGIRGVVRKMLDEVHQNWRGNFVSFFYFNTAIFEDIVHRCLEAIR